MSQPAEQALYQKPPFMGKALSVDENNFVVDFQWKPKFVASVVDLTLTANQSGTFFTNTAATEANITFTLPALATGPWIFWFIPTIATVTMTVTSASANDLIAFNDATATSVSLSTTSEILGGGLIAWSDGTTQGILEMVHEGQTAVVA
jgi:hypothetical protein